MNIIQREIKIPTGDGHVLYGILDSRRKSDRLAIFVHGLTGHRDEHIFYNASPYFTTRGFDTFRLNLYGEEKKARRLRDATIALHAHDTNKVMDHFGKKYGKLFLVGHSYGGATVLSADSSRAAAIAAWDPSSRLAERGWGDYTKYHRGLGAYLVDWGVESVIGKPMHEEWLHFPGARELMEGVKAPVKIICAGKGALLKGGRAYYKHARTPKAFAAIPGAGHNFNELGTEEKLFRETYDWFKRF